MLISNMHVSLHGSGLTAPEISCTHTHNIHIITMKEKRKNTNCDISGIENYV